MTELDRLRQEEEALARKLSEVRERRVRLEQPVTKPSGDKSRGENSRPLRDIVLDLLADAKTPLNSLLIASVLGPLIGRTVPSTRFGTLSMDEQASFDSKRQRPVYLCHCLTHDQGQAMKRFWGRSDWPLQERIIGPMSGRVLFLRGAIWTIELARKAHQGSADTARLNYIAADQARDAGQPVRHGEFHFDAWIAGIEQLLGKILPEDEALRHDAAVMLDAHLNERELLFGVRPPFVSLPGSRSGWRSASE